MPEDPRSSKNSRACRWLARRWLRLGGGKIRLLPAAGWEEEGSTLLVVGHAPTWSEALKLATAFPHPIRFLLPQARVSGFMARFIARGVGMISYGEEGPLATPVAQAAADVLMRGETLAVFVEKGASSETALGELASTAASLVRQAEAGPSGRRVTIRPVHLFLPSPPSRSREGLIYVDSALPRRVSPSSGGGVDGESKALVSNLEAMLRQNAFQWQPADLDNFFHDLEVFLRTSLQEDWASHENWKQGTEGFTLSRHAVKWITGANYLHPAKLVGLRESLDEYRGYLQQIALRQGEMRTAGAWASSRLRRALVWLETLLGLPIALWGLLNHLVFAGLLWLTGSFKKDKARKRTTEWAIRAALLLGCYVAQTLWVARGWGRAVAGYYAPALPVTGAYLARFGWLLRRRTGPLLRSLRHPALLRRARRRRQTVLDELGQALSPSEEGTPLKLPNFGPSTPAGA